MINIVQDWLSGSAVLSEGWWPDGFSGMKLTLHRLLKTNNPLEMNSLLKVHESLM